MGVGSLLLALCLVAGRAVPSSSISNLALIRPFATTDSAKLPASFDVWLDFPPCAAAPAVAVDLFLCFSQNLSSDAEAAAATRTIIDAFTAQQAGGNGWTWPSCFRHIQAVSTYIAPEDDTYLPSESNDNPDWVKGPNLQFLAMARAFEDGIWGDYDAWFLMEMDTTPRRANWLPDLLQEVTARAPFAVLGSFYRGDQWDKFPMPPAVRHHINGNAVYNQSNPLLRQVVGTLQAAMAAGTTLDAFDVFGAEVYLNSTLPPDQLGWYAGDSAVIGNYAHTPMLDDYFADEALVHGGWLYAAWNATTQPITLLVSDFGRWDAEEPAWSELETFEAALLRGRHPFRRVVVVRPPANVSAAPYVKQTTGDMGAENVVFQQVARNDSVWFDWCTAPIDTPWFLYTNVFFDFRHRVDLRVTLNGSLPVASYTPAGSQYCLNSSVCVYTMGRAKKFSGYAPTGHVDISQLVLRTAQRDTFCAAWREWHTSQPAVDCEPIPGPTADDYAAYLLSQGLNDLYSWENAVQRGQRPLGVQRSFPADPRPCAFPAVVANASLCDLITEESTCSSVPGCAWRPHFDICFQGSLVTVPTPPALNVTYGNPVVCADDFAAPLLRISNLDSRNVTLQVPGVPGWQRTLGPGAATDLPAWAGSATVGTVAVQPVVVVSTAPHVLYSEPVPLYPLQGLTAVASPQQTYMGHRISVSAGTTAVSRLEVQPPAGLLLVSPVETSDGWVRSSDDAAPNLIVFDTSGLPPATTQLALAVRLTGTVAAVSVQRCTAVTIDLVPTATVPCASALLLSSYEGQADSAVIAKVVTSNSPLGNVSGFTWTIGAGLPITTTVPTATLTLPIVPTTANLTAAVVVVDVFGRSMTCLANVTVLGADPAVVMEVAKTQCSSDTVSTTDMRCLQAATALAAATNATEATSAAAVAVVVQTLTNVANALQVNSSADSNAVLSQLSLLANTTTTASSAQVQSALFSVLDRVVDSCPLDGSSAGPLLAVVSPLLAQLTTVLATPARSTANATSATGSTGNGTQGLAQRVADTVDQAAIKMAASQTQLYSSSSVQSPTHCLNLSWAYHTADSLPAEYAGLRLTDALAAVLPPTVRLIVSSTAPSCNVFRTTLGGDAQVRRLLLLNGTTGELLTAETFLRLTGGAVDLWRAPLVFETAPTTAGGPTSALRAKFAPLDVRQSLTASCVTQDPVSGQRLLFAPANGTCGMRFPGSVSAIWASPTERLLDNVTVSQPTPTAAGGGQWVIAVGAGAAVAGCAVASAVAFWFGRRRCLPRRETREPDKVYAPAEAPVEEPLQFLPPEKPKPRPEPLASDLLEPLPSAKHEKVALGVAVGSRGGTAKEPFRGIPPLTAVEEWRRRSTLYSADSAGRPSLAPPHGGLQLHPSPFPSSARTWRSFSLALQDDFDDYGDDPPDLQEGSGLQADAPLPLFPRRRPSASPLPRSAEQRLGRRSMCVDGASTLSSHGPLQSPTPPPDGLAPRWDNEHGYPDWYLLPRRRDRSRDPSAAPCLTAESPTPTAAGPRPAGGAQPWVVITPSTAGSAPGGPDAFPLDPVLPFEANDDSEGAEGSEPAPGWQLLTPRVAWGIVDVGDIEAAAAAASSSARRKSSCHLTFLEEFSSEASDKGSNGSRPGSGSGSGSGSGLPPEPFEAWRRRSTAHSEASQMDCRLHPTLASRQSVCVPGEAAEDGEGTEAEAEVRWRPGTEWPHGAPVPRPTAIHEVQRRRRSEFVPRAQRPEHRCASLCVAGEDGASPGRAVPPLRAWDPARLAEVEAEERDADAEASGARVPPHRRGSRLPASVPPPPREEVDVEEAEEDATGRARERTFERRQPTSLPAPSPIPRPVRRQSCLSEHSPPLL